MDIKKKKTYNPSSKKKKKIQSYKYFVNDPGKMFAIVTLLQLIFSI
jgi:hypothetical protein